VSEQPSLPNICHSIQNSSPWSLELPNNECSSWNLKIFDNGVRYRGESNILSSRRVSESDVKALCLKNSAGGLKNVFDYSGRCARFDGDDIMFVGGNLLDKIGRIPKDRSRLLTDFSFKPSPNRELTDVELRPRQTSLS
jgi:hypothetical protein